MSLARIFLLIVNADLTAPFRLIAKLAAKVCRAKNIYFICWLALAFGLIRFIATSIH